MAPAVDVLGRRVLGDVVRQAADARGEDHRRRADPGEHLGVVAGTARQAPGRVAEALGGGLDEVDGRRVELDGFETGERASSSPMTCSASARRATSAASARSATTRSVLVGVAQIDRDRRRRRHDVDEVGAQVDAPDGGDLGAAEALRRVADERGDRCGDESRVSTQPHRRRTGMSRTSGDRQLGPGDALHAFDDSDRHPLVLEDRSLLDVQLDVGVWRRRRGHGNGPA